MMSAKRKMSSQFPLKKNVPGYPKPLVRKYFFGLFCVVPPCAATSTPATEEEIISRYRTTSVPNWYQVDGYRSACALKFTRTPSGTSS